MDGTGGHATLKDHTGRVVREGKKASEDSHREVQLHGRRPSPDGAGQSVSSALRSQLPSLGPSSFSSCVCPGRLPPLDPSHGFSRPLLPLWVYPMSIRGYRRRDGHFSLPSFLRAVLAGVNSPGPYSVHPLFWFQLPTSSCNNICTLHPFRSENANSFLG